MISAYVLNVLHSPRTSKDQRDLYYLNFSLDTKSRLSQIKDQRRYGQWLMKSNFRLCFVASEFFLVDYNIFKHHCG